MIDLTPRQLDVVRQILDEHVPECEVRAFGSRVTRSAKSYSDLDLAVKGQNAVPQERLNRLVEAFEESDLPFRVDVVDWNDLSDSFRQVIDKCCEVIRRPSPPYGGNDSPEFLNYESVTSGSNISLFVRMAATTMRRERQVEAVLEWSPSSSRCTRGHIPPRERTWSEPAQRECYACSGNWKAPG